MIPSLEIKWIFKENINNKKPESIKLERNIEKLKTKWSPTMIIVWVSSFVCGAPTR